MLNLEHLQCQNKICILQAFWWVHHYHMEIQEQSCSFYSNAKIQCSSFILSWSHTVSLLSPTHFPSLVISSFSYKLLHKTVFFRENGSPTWLPYHSTPMRQNIKTNSHGLKNKAQNRVEDALMSLNPISNWCIGKVKCSLKNLQSYTQILFLSWFQWDTLYN